MLNPGSFSGEAIGPAGALPWRDAPRATPGQPMRPWHSRVEAGHGGAPSGAWAAGLTHIPSDELGEGYGGRVLC